LTMLTRIIPCSGEKLPVIGLGTWRAFDVDLTAEIRSQLADVLSRFVELGGRVIDSSPMYGRAEQVIGELTSSLGIREKLFLATKVWTRGKQNGIESMERSLRLFRANRIDLMQVHNLVDVNTQLVTLREWKQQGRLRYTGITHYESGALSDIEKLIRSEKFDFLQINYSLMECAGEWWKWSHLCSWAGASQHPAEVKRKILRFLEKIGCDPGLSREWNTRFMRKLLTLTFVLLGAAAFCPRPAMALVFSAPNPKF